jgi:hypothetical protein
MIRGAIDSVSRNKLYGWVWSPDVDLRGRKVLAFLDEACIGAGAVEDFRPDLKDAGLGDGIAGYNFNLTYANPADAPRIVVRLEGSDAVLIQKRSRVMPNSAGNPARGPASRQQASLASLQWMRGRGWISQSDFDFLRFFRQLGVYDRTLVVPSERPDKPEVALHDPAEMALFLLQLHRMEEVEMKRETVPTIRDYRVLAERIEAKGGPGAVLAVWSRSRGRVPVIEESHRHDDLIGEGGEPPPGADYAIGPDRLLFLDGRCALGRGAGFPQAGADVFYLAV